MEKFCIGFDYKMDKCKFKVLDNTNTCKFHIYMKDYSEDMIKLMKLCKTCRKNKYIENNFNTCNDCRNKGQINRKKIIQKTHHIKCLYNNCKFKRSEINEYCGKHQLQIFLNDLIDKNKKPCYNYKRGCRNELNLEYEYSKCEVCLKQDRIIDNKKRKNALEIRNCENNLNSDFRTCTVCLNTLEKINFIKNKKSVNELTLTCINCRKENSNQNSKRNKEHRKNFCRKSINIQYSEYVKNAKNRNIEFDITKEQYINIINNPCKYCNTIDKDKGFNGLDRLNSNLNYTINNVVSCCIMCNYMKRIDLPEIFIKKVKNIIDYHKYNKNIETISKSYNSKITLAQHFKNYINRAKKSNIEFTINFEEFKKIILDSCYLCGKKSENNIHLNGIDRVNNKEGYILTNCKSCCRDCNFMKNDYNLYVFIEKLESIYNNIT